MFECLVSYDICEKRQRPDDQRLKSGVEVDVLITRLPWGFVRSYNEIKLSWDMITIDCV